MISDEYCGPVGPANDAVAEDIEYMYERVVGRPGLPST